MRIILLIEHHLKLLVQSWFNLGQQNSHLENDNYVRDNIKNITKIELQELRHVRDYNWSQKVLELSTLQQGDVSD
jgi:hypothetical protein